MPEAEEMAVDGKEPITQKLSIQTNGTPNTGGGGGGRYSSSDGWDHAILPMVVLAL